MKLLMHWFKKPIFLYAYVAVVLLGNLNQPTIYILDEARNAQCAREMLQQHEWIVPTFNNELRAQKPPLHYYAMKLGYTLLGSNSMGARLFSVLAGLFTIVIIYRFVKRIGGEQWAIAAVWALALSTHFLFECRLAVPDPYLIFFNTACLVCLFYYQQRQQFYFLYAASFLAALSVLCKGPVGVALPIISFFIFAVFKKNYKSIFNFHILFAVVFFFIIALPWFYLVHQYTNGDFTTLFFLKHNVDRFKAPMEGHGGVFILIWLFALIGLMPAAAWLFNVKILKTQFIENDLFKFSSIVVLVYLIFYCVAGTKLPNYAMPCYPFAAIIIGQLFLYWYHQPNVNKRIYFFIALFYLILTVAVFFLLKNDRLTQKLAWVSFSIIILPIGCFVAWFINAKHKALSVSVFLIATILFNIVLLLFAYPALYQLNPVEQTKHVWQQQNEIVAYKIYNPAYNFYLNKNIVVFDSVTLLNIYLKQHPSTLVLSRENYLPELSSLSLQLKAHAKDIFENPTTVILGKP
ncbi:ArnT family glycosyltransferase [Ferruginibacter yonginensis]|uniref:ArnT family glycosyltransferase n=1 Tax=Ferruginibacter yonginensis TaxID=1310416 RepID=A0ABV8QTD8_9BACT